MGRNRLDAVVKLIFKLPRCLSIKIMKCGPKVTDFVKLRREIKGEMIDSAFLKHCNISLSNPSHNIISWPWKSLESL